MAKKASYLTIMPIPDHVAKRNPAYRGTPNCNWFIEKVCCNIPVTDKVSAAQTDRVVKSLVTCLRNYRQYLKDLENLPKPDHSPRVTSDMRNLRPKL